MIHTVNERNTESPFIVGIGASAGGLEAIHDLFDYMPEKTGLSFVIIQHLSPNHKSLLAELLTRHTVMPVYEAEDGMPIKTDAIYVIPARKVMTVQGDVLRLKEKEKTKQPNNAIDIFFESLARERSGHAVAIVLSGTGTDGTNGIKAIKENGGIVIVQDPLSAAFDGMPNSAVATGQADSILPPEMIGEELAELLKDNSFPKSFALINKKDEEQLYGILTMLNKITHYDFSQYKRPTLFRRIAKRMAELGIDSIDEYKAHLAINDEEVKSLGREFLINVTKFFRDADAFGCLEKEVVPAVVNAKDHDGHVKIWVAACSTGEEAYSIAILFLEYLEKTGHDIAGIKIFATDIDAHALEIASKGVYHESIARDITAQRLEKYFVREGNSYRVSIDLRKIVVFANHNVLKDPPFRNVDLVSCRNMFIYMNTGLQRTVLKKFHYALNLNAFLILGPSENISVLKDAMHEIDRKWKVYRCVTKGRIPDHDILLSPLDDRAYVPVRKAAVAPRSTANGIAANLGEIFRETWLDGHQMAQIIIDKDFNVKQATGQYKRFLSFPEDNFNFNLLKLLQADLAVAAGVAIRKAISNAEPVSFRHVVIHEDKNVNRQVNLAVKPYLKENRYQQDFLCVVFEEEQSNNRSNSAAVTGGGPFVLGPVEELERELADTRQNLQAIIEELETANEEMQSGHEELISTNEELQSTNEELQSLNEELHTVSAEHQLKIKELLELNDDLNNYFVNSDIGQILLDKNLVIRRFSPPVTRMINLIPADVGRTITDITTSIREFDFAQTVRHVLETSVTIERETHTPEDRYFIVRISPYIRRDKSVDGIVVNFIDITESKRLSSIIQSVFESSTNGIAAKKAIRNEHKQITDLEFLAANQAAENIFGAAPGALPGARLSQLRPNEYTSYLQRYARVIETGRTETFEAQTPQGRWFSITAVKMLDGIVTTHTDVTEKKKAESLIAKNYEELKATSQKLIETNAQLERSNFDLLQFASVASHDLKEPLRKIQAFGNMLQSKVKDKLAESESTYLDKMISASGRMQVLIEDVLTLSKLSNSGIAHEAVNLNGIIKRICDDLEITIREKNAIVNTQALPVVRAVPGQMRQLFQNLISNALKFNDKPVPKINISSLPVTPEIGLEYDINPALFTCIQVADNGIGFEDEYREKIFGIFQRLHGRNYEGTGIGLAIARKIVGNHGGLITASAQPEVGSVFNIYLPLSEHDL